MKRLVLILLVGCSASDGGPNPTDHVASLPNGDQQRVCDDFVAAICSDPGFASFCTACATGAGCAMAVSANAIDTECALAPDNTPITVGMVDECASTGSFEVCTKGGGCMFDAIEAVCP